MIFCKHEIDHIKKKKGLLPRGHFSEMFARSISAVKEEKPALFCNPMNYIRVRKECELVICWENDGMGRMLFSYGGELHLVKTKKGTLIRRKLT